MSYCDTFDNEFVGYFGGIPVYHPLEAVPPTLNDPECFACGPENLLIGGGRGEHPGIVVKSPEETVDCFVRAWLADENPFLSSEERQSLKPALEIWLGAADQRHTKHRRVWSDVFEFAGWRVADFVEFTTRCASRAFHRPFDQSCDDSLEQWLAESIGEFIFLAMPELAGDSIERLGDLRSCVKGAIYKNVLLLPPGYPAWGRRESNGHVTWGISAWQIQRQQHARTIRG